VKGTIRKALGRSGADYAEVRLEREVRTQVFFRKDRLENVESSSDAGGVVRALVNGGWGFAVFNDPSNLEQKVKEATSAARLVAARAKEKVELAVVPVVEKEVRATLKKDYRKVPLEEKKDLVESYNRILLAEGSKVVSTVARYTDSFREVTFANSDGTYLVQEIPDVTLMLAAMASDGGANIQQAFESFGEAAGYEVVLGFEEKARVVAKRAVDLLSARSVAGGQYTVVLDPGLAGVFIHEAFGHFCEADFLFKNERLMQLMKLGNEFGVKALNVVDEGYLPGLRGNVPYDDEGVERKKAHLIKKGVLSGLLHSRETARKMGAEPTGNARAMSYEHPPIVRMRNTYIEDGQSTFQEMLKGVDRGLYAVEAYGGQTALEQFSFSAAYAHEIVRGEVGELVRDVVLTGNVFETLRAIDRIGNDREMKGGAGGCGKGGQYPLPVTDGSPHIRIQNVTIGGH
jgi:TldD protein